MALVPEFFTLLGIVIFLALSFVCALLDDDLPSKLPYIFQGAAIVGLAALIISQGFINTGTYGSNPTNPRRIWISVVYLYTAVSSAAGLNVYLATARRNMSLSSILSGTLTAPTFMISAVLIASYLETGGTAILEPGTIMILAVLGSIISFTLFGLLREASKHGSTVPSLGGSSPPDPVPTPEAPSIPLPFSPPTIGTDYGWEESPRKKESVE